MVCTANDLLGWRDFPKGLRVLLLDEDNSSASEIRTKLEEMDYFVSTFFNEKEALAVISNKSVIFHVAIVEVNSDNSDGRLKFLETAKDLPTIMTSSMHCLTTMMKCIALGAVEFLQKPLSEDKLRNIWQHVVHKAFNAGGKDVPESLKPIKESVVSMLNLQLGNLEKKNEMSGETEQTTPIEEDNVDLLAGNKYPAPSTPQQKHGAKLADDMDYQDQNKFSSGKDIEEPGEEFKSVETTCRNLVDESPITSPPQQFAEGVVKENIGSVGGFTSEIKPFCPSPRSIGCPRDLGGNERNLKKGSCNSSGTKANRKKMKVDWTPELHKNFVQAVEQLGVDQAIPSRILELMKVEGLTRHNVASHLQKYRMHQRHILPKEDDRRWGHARESAKRGYYPYKPTMVFPPYQRNQPLPASQVYPTWGSPSGYTAGIQMWSSPYYSPWQPLMHADAWRCPVLPSSPGPCPSFRPADEEVVDKVVKEAISKPWLPLPLGLKPPSSDSVLTELSRQGISTVPPGVKHPR